MDGKEMNRIPSRIHSIKIYETVFQKTLEELRRIGDGDKEGIAYWSGTLNETDATIKNVDFADEYTEFHNEELFASVSLDMSFKIGEKIHQRNEILFAQVHTHPFEAFHSFVDNTYPISHRIGFFSIVIPHFGKNVNSLLQCKIFEYEGKAKWHELDNDEIKRKFEVDADG
jgi:hypothetical protein